MTYTPMQRKALEEENLVIAKKVKALMPEGRGFALFTFDYGPKGYVAYASTGTREDMLVAVGKWFVSEMEKGEADSEAVRTRIAEEARIDALEGNDKP